jgi:hypothetical protein
MSYDDAYLGQTVSYAGYLNGNISATNFIYKGQAAQFANNYNSITYDRLGRLLSADNGTASYDIGVPSPLLYDRNGNILSLTRQAQTVNYAYASGTNKVTGLSNGKSYQYDLNGNITVASDKVPNGITYDPYTQMTRAMRTSATELVQFNYDAANERVLKLATSPSKTEATLYLHGLSEYPLVDKVDNGESVYERLYIYGTTGLIAIREGAGIGAVGYTASVGFSVGGFNNWRWGEFGKAIAMGSVSGMASAGIGSMFGAVGSMGFTGELARAYTHGLANAGVNAAFGNGAGLGSFASGAAGSLMGRTTAAQERMLA